MTTAWLIIQILLYMVAARLVVTRMRGSAREIIFAGLNLAGYYCCFIEGKGRRFAGFFAVYILLALVQYLMLRIFTEQKNRGPWMAFFTPLLALVIIRYVPGSFYLSLRSAWPEGMRTALDTPIASYFIGISYLAFRTSRLVLEIRNGMVSRPSLCQYLGFCFFVPTMAVGPINTYANYRRGFDAGPLEIPYGHAALRILVGLAKLKVVGAVCDQLSYAGLLRDGHYHPWMDLPVAMVFYYLFLYCNFSGFCDMAIGLAAFIGIAVPENFDNPLAARNMKEFWNRWHITLSVWMRDIVFSPLSKFLVGKFGTRLANHAVAVSIIITFLLIGVWHGVGWNYALFGMAQALGVVTVHYYTIFLKKRLGRDRFKAYNENRLIHAVAVVITFCYYAATLFLFANTLLQMREIFALLKW